MGIKTGIKKRGPMSPAAPAAEQRPTTAARVLSRLIESSARLQGPAVRTYLERLRKAHPGAAPADIVARLERRYLLTVIVGGALVGSLAAIPAIGTLVAFSAIAAETAVFLEATALFVLAVAEVHNIPAEHREQRRALVLAVLVGSDGKRAVADLLSPGRTNGAWLSESTAMPLPAVSQLNSRLVRHFVRRFTLRRGVLALGKLLPVGIGAVIGGVGNRMMGKKIIANAHTAFGEPPARWPVTLHLLPRPHDEATASAAAAVVGLPER